MTIRSDARRLCAIVSVIAPVCVSCRVAECPPPELSRSMIASEPVAGAAGVRGVVLAISDGRALPTARVRLSPGPAGWQRVSGDGRFRIANSGGGAATLEVRTQGYDAASVAIPARGDSTVVVLAALAAARVPRRAVGCGGRGIIPTDTVD